MSPADIGGKINRWRLICKCYRFTIETALLSAREPLNNSLHAQSFRLARNLGAILMACWLPVEKAQQRVRASLKDPEGAA
ncbi:MAG: hypothetical protein COA55_07920 [Alcanivorax sp.]|nr:MAG: hypothetical protein COA55_07920 [Alcanivorax sp.]